MNFIIKGDIAYSTAPDKLETYPDHYLVCENGISQGVFPQVPERYKDLKQYDFTGKLVIPGMVDLHLHAPQFAFRGMHMDEELLEWLNRYTFPEEARFADPSYARNAYFMFAETMRKSATTRAVIFATIHPEATIILMDEMEKTGLVSYVGKVNMDREAPENILDASAEVSARDTVSWIEETKNKYQRTSPILTPRFIPSCTNELLSKLKEIVHKYDIPVQSHLSENPGEVEWVKALMPESRFYGDAYDWYDLFGKPAKTIMAHCVYSTDEEIDLMKENGVYVAHCPSSNMNLSSGIAPIRRYLNLGMHIGLGSDVAAGESESIFGEMRAAIAVSKLYNRYVDGTARPLTFPEAFYLATLSGGSFFGKVGSFEEGYEMDILVLEDDQELHPQKLNLEERLERSIYLRADKNHILAKFVRGERIL